MEARAPIVDVMRRFREEDNALIICYIAWASWIPPGMSASGKCEIAPESLLTRRLNHDRMTTVSANAENPAFSSP